MSEKKKYVPRHAKQEPESSPVESRKLTRKTYTVLAPSSEAPIQNTNRPPIDQSRIREQLPPVSAPQMQPVTPKPEAAATNPQASVASQDLAVKKTPVEEPVKNVKENDEISDGAKKPEKSNDSVTAKADESKTDTAPEKKKQKISLREFYNKHKVLILSALGFIVLVGIWMITPHLFDKRSSSSGKTDTTINNTVDIKDRTTIEYQTMWLDNRSINPDYTCQLIFDSGLLDLPIVQVYDDVHRRDGTVYTFYSEEGNFVNSYNVETDGCDGHACNGNDVYLRVDWKTGDYDFWGSNFIDYRNSLNDQNIIIYGHHSSRDYFGDEVAEGYQFTKLDLLLDKENYDANKSFSLIFGDQIRKYEIAYICKIDSSKDEDLQVYRTYIDTALDGNYEEDFWPKYLNLLKSRSIYTTGADIKEDDKLVTLSTCIQGSPTLKEIIVAKEVERRYIS